MGKNGALLFAHVFKSITVTSASSMQDPRPFSQDERNKADIIKRHLKLRCTRAVKKMLLQLFSVALWREISKSRQSCVNERLGGTRRGFLVKRRDHRGSDP